MLQAPPDIAPPTQDPQHAKLVVSLHLPVRTRHRGLRRLGRGEHSERNR